MGGLGTNFGPKNGPCMIQSELNGEIFLECLMADPDKILCSYRHYYFCTSKIGKQNLGQFLTKHILFEVGKTDFNVLKN